MKEAKARNPKIILDALPWGAPGWSSNGNYYSQDIANHTINFIQSAKKQQGLDITYVGTWNETNYDVGYIKLMKKTLLANGLTTNAVAADLYENQWKITDDFKLDPELKKDVYAISVHYARVKGNFYVTGGALHSGKPSPGSPCGPAKISLLKKPESSCNAIGNLRQGCGPNSSIQTTSTAR
jgi:hypothetical protein